MGDIHGPITTRRPGIAVVRPKLHKDTQENQDLFKRWTKLHMRDTLSLPTNEELGRASRVLRYTRTDVDGREEYLYTIHLDDVRLPATEAFQTIPQRLDLENTRALGEGEEAVLPPSHPLVGKEPMVFSIVAPSVGIFEAVVDMDTLQTVHKSYQDIPAEVATVSKAPKCTLITLTISSPAPASTPFSHIQKLRASLVNFLVTIGNNLVYVTLYRHAEDVQPETFPKIAEGQDGNGDWVVCVLVVDGADKKLSEAGLEDVEGQVEEWLKRMRIDGSMEGFDVKTGVWRGDVFMS